MLELIAGLAVAVLGVGGLAAMLTSRLAKSKAALKKHETEQAAAKVIRDEIIDKSANTDNRARLRDAYTRQDSNK